MRNFYATTHEETKIRSAPFFPSRSNLHRQTWQLTVCLWARSYAVMNFIKEKHIQSIWNGVLSPRSHIVITHIIPLLMNCNASQRWCAKTLVWCGCLPSNSLFHFENFFFFSLLTGSFWVHTMCRLAWLMRFLLLLGTSFVSYEFPSKWFFRSSVCAFFPFTLLFFSFSFGILMANANIFTSHCVRVQFTFWINSRWE